MFCLKNSFEAFCACLSIFIIIGIEFYSGDAKIYQLNNKYYMVDKKRSNLSSEYSEKLLSDNHELHLTPDELQ
jgi:hypothetical protein